MAKTVSSQASERWWKQLSLYGANPQMLFTAAMRTEKKRIIRNFGKVGSVSVLSTVLKNCFGSQELPGSMHINKNPYDAQN